MRIISCHNGFDKYTTKHIQAIILTNLSKLIKTMITTSTVLSTSLLIFVLRVINIALDTLRVMFVVQRKRVLSAFVGFIQAIMWIVVMKAVLDNLENFFSIVAYAGGYSAGILVGMALEERLAIGFSHVRIVTSQENPQISTTLRKAGYGVTDYIGQGKDGRVLEVNVIAKRRDLTNIEEIVSKIDPDCFVTSEAITPLRRGYWRVQ